MEKSNSKIRYYMNVDFNRYYVFYMIKLQSIGNRTIVKKCKSKRKKSVR